MERIVFLDRKTCKVKFRPPRFKHQWRDYDTSPPEQVVERILDATIVITNKVKLGAHELKPLPALRLIAVAATGVDNVDLAYCREHGITVVNVPHYATRSVSELVFTLMLALRRNLREYRTAVRAGLWQKSKTFSMTDFPTHDLADSTLGIIGYGAIAQAVEAIGRAFGMDILIAERKHTEDIRPGRVPFEKVLTHSDVLTLHAPLTDATRKLIGSTEFTKMKPTALLINTARGGLIDEQALANVLQMKLLGGAGLDVLSQEPPTSDNPLLALDLPNLIITPHIGWASDEAVATMAELLITNLEMFVTGQPQNVVS